MLLLASCIIRHRLAMGPFAVGGGGVVFSPTDEGIEPRKEECIRASKRRSHSLGSIPDQEVPQGAIPGGYHIDGEHWLGGEEMGSTQLG